LIRAGTQDVYSQVQIACNSSTGPDQTFFRQLSSPTGGATIPTSGRAQAIIVEDDGPKVSISDVSVHQGTSGSRPANFVLTLSAASFKPITVTYHTMDGGTNPAVAGSDYVAVPAGTVVIPAGQTTVTLPITVLGNTLDQTDRTFFVVIDSATIAVLPPGTQGTGTIISDNGPTLSISSATVTE